MQTITSLNCCTVMSTLAAMLLMMPWLNVDVQNWMLPMTSEPYHETLLLTSPSYLDYAEHNSRTHIVRVNN